LALSDKVNDGAFPSPHIYNDGWYEIVGLPQGITNVAIYYIGPSGPLGPPCCNLFDPQSYSIYLDDTTPFMEDVNFNVFCDYVGYNVSGSIYCNGEPLRGVTVSIFSVDENGQIGQLKWRGYSGADGSYTAYKIPPGNCIAIPSIYGYEFIPQSQIFTVTHTDVQGIDFLQ